MLQNSKDSEFSSFEIIGMKQDFILILINKPINYLHYGEKNDFLRWDFQEIFWTQSN